MGLNDVTFERTAGGLARQLPSEDNISGQIYYGFALPVGFDGDTIKRLTCLEDAESYGIAPGSVDYALIHYHIKEFYRKAPGAILFIGLFPTPVTVDFNEIWLMKQFSKGKIRQCSVYTTRTTLLNDVQAIQTICTKLHTEHAPGSVLYACDMTAIVEAGLPDLRALECPNVSVILGQDGANAGAALFASLHKSVTCIGAILGAVAAAAVHENIGWVKKFRMDATDGSGELSVPALADGTTLASLTQPNVDDMNAKGYIFLVQHAGLDASYINDSHCCVGSDSDYAYIENNRTMDKSEREVRRALLPELSGPVLVDPSSGKISRETIAYLEAVANGPLEIMTRAGELSGVAVNIPPDQNILTTSELIINIGEVPVGVARKIKVKIGFKLNV